MQRLTGLMTIVMVLTSGHSALALIMRSVVTATTQYNQGLEFTVTATPGHDATVNVHITIPQKGKLKNLAAAQLELDDGEHVLLKVPLVATTHDGTAEIYFQIARKLVPQCYVNLFPEPNKDDRDFMLFYAVSLKSYMPAPAVDPG